MRPERSESARLRDMLDYAERVMRFVEGKTLDDYERDDILRLAVERGIEVVGEAARFVTEATRRAHPQVPWQAIVVQRHVIAHEYGMVKHERVWRVAVEHLPRLVEALRTILAAREEPPLKDEPR